MRTHLVTNLMRGAKAPPSTRTNTLVSTESHYPHYFGNRAFHRDIIKKPKPDPSIFNIAFTASQPARTERDLRRRLQGQPEQHHQELTVRKGNDRTSSESGRSTTRRRSERRGPTRTFPGCVTSTFRHSQENPASRKTAPAVAHSPEPAQTPPHPLERNRPSLSPLTPDPLAHRTVSASPRSVCRGGRAACRSC